MSKTQSVDKEYLKKVVAASQEYEPGEDLPIDTSTSKGKASLTVSIPGMAATDEESKGGDQKANMDDLLSGFEDELGIGAGPDFGEDSAATIS